MPAVIYVHGFSAGELHLDPALTQLLWVDTTRLLIQTPARMRLAPDGQTPDAPSGRQLYVGAPLTPWYQLVRTVLDRDLHQLAYRQLAFSWDWRKRHQDAGQQLADLVRNTGTDDDQVVLIGHSAGGLVCRAAWADLGRTGDQVRVRRIITLGTPHCGTYYAVATWSGLGTLVGQLAAMGQTLGGPLLGWLAVQGGSFTVEAITSLAATWPALYQLLPVVGAPDSAGDPHRAELYSASAWSGAAPTLSADHLDESLKVWTPFLLGPDSVPPPWILTTIAGDGLRTWDRLADPAQLGTPAAIGYSDSGDGVVTRASATLGTGPSYVLTCGHSDLPGTSAVEGILTAEVLAKRSPPQLPVLPVVDLTPVPVSLSEPPLGALSLSRSGTVCAGHPCACG